MEVDVKKPNMKRRVTTGLALFGVAGGAVLSHPYWPRHERFSMQQGGSGDFGVDFGHWSAWLTAENAGIKLSIGTITCRGDGSVEGYVHMDAPGSAGDITTHTHVDSAITGQLAANKYALCSGSEIAPTAHGEQVLSAFSAQLARDRLSGGLQ